MAALLVFIVFLVAIAVSIPIGISMILGSIAPIFLMDKGGSIAQLINNTFSGANSHPHPGGAPVHSGRRHHGRGRHLQEAV